MKNCRFVMRSAPSPGRQTGGIETRLTLRVSPIGRRIFNSKSRLIFLPARDENSASP
ncbi:Uncharacterised protein [Vibrio cholerae]|nr:Uncharacterised protein [Vibrio cholerae]